MSNNTELINKFKKYYKLNNKYNTDKYQHKINNIGKKLGELGVINYGGVLTYAQIQELLAKSTDEVDKKINLHIDLDKQKEKVDIIVINHTNIIKIIKDYKLALEKLLEERKSCIDELKLKEEEPINSTNKEANKEAIDKLKEKLDNYNKQIEEKKELLISLVKEKDVKGVIGEINTYVDKKINKEAIDFFKFSTPIKIVLEKLDSLIK